MNINIYLKPFYMCLYICMLWRSCSCFLRLVIFGCIIPLPSFLSSHSYLTHELFYFVLSLGFLNFLWSRFSKKFLEELTSLMFKNLSLLLIFLNNNVSSSLDLVLRTHRQCSLALWH